MTTPETLHLDAIGQIHVTVKEVDRAIAFYRDVLGMELLFEVPEQSMAFFECGGIRLYLGKAESPDFASSPVIYYRVDSLPLACDRLHEHGVPLTEEPHIIHRTDSHELWMAGFRDSEENPLVLMSEVATSTGGSAAS